MGRGQVWASEASGASEEVGRGVRGGAERPGKGKRGKRGKRGGAGGEVGRGVRREAHVQGVRCNSSARRAAMRDDSPMGVGQGEVREVGHVRQVGCGGGVWMLEVR